MTIIAFNMLYPLHEIIKTLKATQKDCRILSPLLISITRKKKIFRQNKKTGKNLN